MTLRIRLIWLLTGLICYPAYAEKIADIPYGTDKEQRFDVYLPDEMPQNAPIVVMVHGGAWRIGDKDNAQVVDNKSAHYNGKGYLFISVNYRMDGDVSPIAQADDIAHAVMEIEKRAGEWGGDPSKIILMGHSAGAHLVGLVSAAPPTLQYPWRGSILLDSAALDLVSLMGKNHYRFYDRVFGRDKEFWRMASPYHQLQGKTAPMLLICSTKRDISCDQAEAFQSKAQQLGTNVDLLKQDMTHREINEELGKPGRYTSRVDVFMDSALR